MSLDPAMGFDAAMRAAMAEAERIKGTTYPNPPVGAVVLDAAGDIVGRGATEPVGGAHAEVVALREAGERARGGTAVVTLEPCNHHGRTPPCVDAVLAAGISTVVYAVADPNPVAADGAGRLAAAGVGTVPGVLADEVAAGSLREWLHKLRTGRPHVTWKVAGSIDGRSAAADGTSQWITSPQARADVHLRRAAADAVIVGTGTVFADDPALTARTSDGALYDRQPLRVVVGLREIGANYKVRNADSPTELLRTRDPAEVLRALGDRTDLFLESGPALASAFLRAGYVDRILAYVAPILIGGPNTIVDTVGVDTLTQAPRWRYDSVDRVGPDVLLSLVPA